MTTRSPSNRLVRRFGIFVCALAFLIFHAPVAASDTTPPFRLGDPRLAAAIPPPMDASGFGRGNYLVLEVQRDFARPQDRWVDLIIDASALPGKFEDYTLEATLSAVTESVKIGALRFKPETKKILLQVDMRRTDALELWVAVTATKDGKRVDGVQYRLRAEGPENPLQQGDTIPVKIDFPVESAAAGPSPVVIGVPFAPGQLWNDERLSLQTTDGVAVPFQREVTGTWIDGGSIQWVQFRTIVEPDAKLVVAVDAQDAQPSPSGWEIPLLSKTSADQLSMKAGTSRVLIGKGPSPILEVIGKERSIATSKGSRGLYLVDSKGRLAQSAANADITIEANGPLYACVRIEADYVTDSEEAVARHITRIESWKDRDAVSITHTLVLTRDTNELWFQEAGWEFSIPGKNLEELRAVFAIDANDFEQVQEVPIDSSTKAAFIFQESYPSIGGGQAAFQIGKEKDSGGFEVGIKGSAMGDWGGYRASDQGLFWAVKDAARQHPKEIFVSLEKLNLLLFSNRAGEEMDFRTETLEKRWGVDRQLDTGQLEKFRSHTSNAVGWSKTHELLLLPVAREVENDVFAAEAMRLRNPVYAMVEPSWIYQSLAMGPLYPYDPERFPDAETLMQTVFEQFTSNVPGDRYNGFFDYHAGPHYSHAGRYRLTYTLLHDAWLYAARTGRREVRQFAEGSNRAFRDNYINHWESPGKRRGLFVDAEGGTGGWRKSDFPFYWEESTSPDIATTTSLMQFIWDYQFSGNRRSAEVVRNFAEGLKAYWKPDMEIWRAFMVLRVIGQAWQFTNDAELLVLLEETANHSIYDPEGEFLMSRDNRPYRSSLYKTNTDVGTMIQLWELLGTQRWREMALRTSDYWWRKRAGLSPIYRISGLYLNFLYDVTRSAAIAQTIDYNLRRAGASWNPATGEAVSLAFSSLDNIFQGIPYGMDVVVRSGADRKPVASIFQFDDYGNASEWFLKKAKPARAVLFAQPPDIGTPGILASRLRVEALKAQSAYGLDLVSMEQKSTGNPAEGHSSIKLVIPKDAPELVYRITPEDHGRQFAVADSNVPLVFHCAGYWSPSELRPAYAYYFNVPKNAVQPKIFLEGSARIFGPDGKPWQNGEVQSGMVELPADQPGLWSFQLVEPGLVKVFNLPPYFAMNSPSSWFDPGAEDVLPQTASAATREAEQEAKGFFVSGGRGLTIRAKDAAQPLFDSREGTIEFFFKPEWSTFDLRNGMNPVSKEILRIETAQGPWVLTYRIDPTGTTINMGPKEPSHSFYAQVDTHAPDSKNNRQLRAWNTRQIVESGEWVHIALVWGKVEKLGGRQPYTAPSLRIYVNGIGTGVSLLEPQADNIPSGPPRMLVFPRDLNASLRQLRVSSSQRYMQNFNSPPSDSILTEDQETLFLLPLAEDSDTSKEIILDFSNNQPTVE